MIANIADVPLKFLRRNYRRQIHQEDDEVEQMQGSSFEERLCVCALSRLEVTVYLCERGFPRLHLGTRLAISR